MAVGVDIAQLLARLDRIQDLAATLARSHSDIKHTLDISERLQREIATVKAALMDVTPPPQP